MKNLRRERLDYLSEVKGKSGTVARVVAYSQAENSGTKLITFEYEAYRGILAELNTHAILCKNAESSRAVPIKKRIEQIRNNPYVPIHWGSNQAGMVAGEEIHTPIKLWTTKDSGKTIETKDSGREEAWIFTANYVADAMEAWDNAGYHKQIVNRIGEAFTTVKGVITATEWDNFWHLRRAPDADPAIKELADCMWKAKCEVEEKGRIEILKAGEWHTPYVYHDRDKDEPLKYWVQGEKYGEMVYLTLEEALKTSAVACGQVSFRKLDTSEETVERVWNRLMGGSAVHASVTQHQGTPMINYAEGFPYKNRLKNAMILPEFWREGVSHMDRDKQLWSAQFKHWIMFRKTIPNEVCNHYVAVDGE